MNGGGRGVRLFGGLLDDADAVGHHAHLAAEGRESAADLSGEFVGFLFRLEVAYPCAPVWRFVVKICAVLGEARRHLPDACSGGIAGGSLIAVGEYLHAIPHAVVYGALAHFRLMEKHALGQSAGLYDDACRVGHDLVDNRGSAFLFGGKCACGSCEYHGENKYEDMSCSCHKKCVSLYLPAKVRYSRRFSK